MAEVQNLTVAELQTCVRLLDAVAADASLLAKLSQAERNQLLIAAGRISRPNKMEIWQRNKAIRRAKSQERQALDRSARATSSIRSTRLDSVFIPPPRAIDLEAAELQMIDRDTGDEASLAQDWVAGASSRDTGRASGGPRLQKARNCYVCKQEYNDVHHFYDALCTPCARFNYDKRFQTASLHGQVALITGARLKIGYHAALMMLRAGARVVVTTRFPQDAALRFAREADFSVWGARLQVHGLDLRHSPSVEAFTRYFESSYDRLDILINNAAQTVRRPPGFYSHLLEIENLPVAELTSDAQAVLRSHETCKAHLTDGATAAEADGSTWVSDWHAGKTLPAPGLLASARLSQIPYACDEGLKDPDLFPIGRLDADLQQVDLRKMNSWRMRLSDVPTAELLEVQLVNSIAPFILCSKLKPLMLRQNTGQKHIVNVSAMEGKFNRATKTDKHPHTNMAKAALNMMTLTSARDYAKDGIFMNAVDTGWVTDEDPAELSARKQRDHDFQPPLDIVDGAARVIDPIFSGILTGKHSWGNFLKDYFPTQW